MGIERTVPHFGTVLHHDPSGQDYDRLRVRIGVAMLCAVLLAQMAGAFGIF
jgi:hypothetical protein